MSSAIEVLKKAQRDIDTDVYIAWSESEAIEIHNALGEALLALEQQEKRKSMRIGEVISDEIEELHKELDILQMKNKDLKEWLEKEIVKKEYSAKECFDGKDFASEEILQIEINLLNEVLVKLSDNTNKNVCVSRKPKVCLEGK